MTDRKHSDEETAFDVPVSSEDRPTFSEFRLEKTRPVDLRFVFESGHSADSKRQPRRGQPATAYIKELIARRDLDRIIRLDNTIAELSNTLTHDLRH